LAALQQGKAGFRNDQVKITALGANGTIAFGGLDFIRRLDLKFNSPAVATSQVNHDAKALTKLLKKILPHP